MSVASPTAPPPPPQSGCYSSNFGCLLLLKASKTEAGSFCFASASLIISLSRVIHGRLFNGYFVKVIIRCT